MHGDRYIESEDLLVTVWHGPVTWEEWEAVARRQVGDPAWSGGQRRLTDARTADTSATGGTMPFVMTDIRDATDGS